jgi:hypothetical protein
MITNKRLTTHETAKERSNWKRANSEGYNEAFRAALNKRREKVISVINQERPAKEALEYAAKAIEDHTTTR